MTEHPPLTQAQYYERIFGSALKGHILGAVAVQTARPFVPDQLVVPELPGTHVTHREIALYLDTFLRETGLVDRHGDREVYSKTASPLWLPFRVLNETINNLAGDEVIVVPEEPESSDDTR